MDIFTTLIGVLLGGGVLAFVQFLIQRHDSKHDRLKEVSDSISALSDKVDERFDVLNAKIDSVDAKADSYNAVACRVRILRFEDELQAEQRHSKDAWDQCLSDCKTYEDYAKTHTSFRNNITEATIEHVKRSYQERLEKRDWSY